MKRNVQRLLLVAVLMLSWPVQAQMLGDYIFSTGTDMSKWVSMTSATQILTPNNNDGLASSVQSIGFDFPFGEGIYTQFSVNTDGNLRLGPTATGTNGYSTPFSATNANGNNPKINALGCDGYGRTNDHYVKALSTVDSMGDSMLVVEFCVGTFSSSTRSQLYKWQVHLFAGGDIEIVFPSTDDLPATNPAVVHQCGLCVDATDGWVISCATNTATHFTSGTGTTNASGTWFDANRYYRFERPVITCPAVENIVCTAFDVSSVSITWHDNANTTEWVLSLDGGTPFPVSDTAYTFTGLASTRSYEVAVAPVCPGGDTGFFRTITVRTACASITLPYFIDFEREPHYVSGTTPYADAFPNCWTRINDATGTTNYYPYINTTSTYVIHGSKSMYWYHSSTSSYANNQYAVLPPVDTSYDVSELTMTFWARTTATSAPWPLFIVGVLSDPTNTSTFVPVDTITLTNAATMYSVSFSNYTGTGRYVAIRSPRTTTTRYCSLDDVFLTNEWCDIPMNVTANSTTDEITVSWRSNGSNSYSVVLGNDTTIGVTDTFYTFHGLTPNTLYHYAVATECTGDTSLFAEGSIRTLCVALGTLPYTFGFEDLPTGSATVPPTIPCWHHLNNSTTNAGYPYVYASAAHTGDRGLYWYTGAAGSTYQCVVLPAVDTALFPLSSLQLKFWARPSTTSYSPVFQVGVMTNPEDINTFQLVQTVNVQNVTTWQQFSTALSTFTGHGQYIAIRANQSGSAWYAYFDDVTVEVIPACPSIESLSVLATVGAARVTWDFDHSMGVTPVGYEVRYRPVADTATPTTTIVSDPEILLTYLDDDTTYWLSVATLCDEGYGEAATTTFTTQALPCAEWDTTQGGAVDTMVVGYPGTSTTSNMPLNQSYSYSYCQHLILASHIAATDTTTFSGIGFDYAYSQPMTHATNCSIYMGNTTRANMSSSDSTFVPYNQLTLVYAGPLNCVSSGWNYFQFNEGTFTYDGHSNIVVAIVDNSGSSDGTAYVFRYEQIPTGSGAPMSKRVFNNTTPYGPAQMDAARASQSYWRSNMRLLTGGGVDCLRIAHCYPPTVTPMQDSLGIRLSWIPGYYESNWDVDYRPTGSNIWMNAASYTSSTSHVIPYSALQPNTQYDFRVTSLCGDTNLSTTVTFTTPCAFINVPFTCDFDNMATTTNTTRLNIPCWHHHNNGTTYYGYPIISSTSTHSGTRGLYWYLSTTTGTYGDYQVVVLPPVDVTVNPVNTLQVAFWVRPTSINYVPTFQVGVMTDPTDINTFQTVSTVIADHGTIDWMHHEALLDNYTGLGHYIAIRANRGSSLWSAYMDDIVVEPIPLCPRVEDLRLTYIATDSATIAWSDTSSTNTAWYVEYDTVDFTPGGGTATTVVVTDTSYGLAGLDTGKVYYVYVYPDCIGGVFPRFLKVKTLTYAPATLPYSCDYEAAGDNGWEYVSDAQTNYWTVGNAANHGGSRSMYVTNNGTDRSYSADLSYSFATRYLYIPDTGVYAYAFDWVCNGETSADYMRAALLPATAVLVAGNLSGFGSTTELPVGGIPLDGRNRLNLQSEWQHQFGTFQLTTPGYYKLVFFWRNDGSVQNMPPATVDNVSLIPYSCPIIQNISATVGSDSIGISWTPGGSEQSWEIVLNDSLVGVVTDTFYTFTGLIPNTSYTVAIRSICGAGDTSVAYAEYYRTACGDLTTLPYIDNLDSYTAFASSATDITMSCWSRFSDATSFHYPYLASSSTYNHTTGGSKGLYWYCAEASSSYGNYQMMALPTIDISLFPMNNLQFSFWARSSSTSYSPAFVVGVMRDVDEQSFVPVDTIAIGPSTTWTQYDVTFTNYSGTGNRIALRAAYALTNSAWYAYVDDFTIDVIPTCPPVTDVHATANTASTLTLDWTDQGTPTAWQIEYGPEGYTFGSSAATRVTVTSHPATLTGLIPLTYYDCYVRPICSVTDTGRWPLEPVSFPTGMCDNPEVVSIGSTSSTTAYNSFPVSNYYRFSLSETIIDSAELAGMQYITHISYYYNHTVPSTSKTNCTIYFKPTTKTVFSSANDIELLDSTAVMVYVGPINCRQGWNHFILDTTYLYNGTGNLMIIVDDNSNAYNGNAFAFKADACTGYKTLYRYSDTQNPEPTDSIFTGTKSYVQYRVVMRLSNCSEPVCTVPENLTVDTLDYDSATISWTGNGTVYEVALKQLSATTWPAETTVVANTYTFTNLLPATAYEFRVRQDCTADSIGYSDWTTFTFTTDSLPCPAPDSLVVSNTTNATATFAWLPSGDETAWEIFVWNNTWDSLYTVTTDPATVSGFTAGVTYNATIRALCGTLANIEGEWGDTVQFTAATCAPVTGLATSNVTSNSVTLTWTAVTGAMGYRVVCTDGQDYDTVTVTAPTHTFTGLYDATPYTFYVQTMCGAGWYSENWAQVTATTTPSTGTNYYVTTSANNAAYGSVSGGGSHPAGSTVTLTATPNTGYSFTRWNDNVTTNPRSFVVTSDTSFMAYFSDDTSAITEYTVTLTVNDPAMGTLSNYGGTYAEGSTIVVTATANAGYHFVNWSDDNTDNPRTFIVNSDITLQANFGSVGIDAVATASCTLIPNPAKGATTVSVTGISGKVRIAVLDLSGREVLAETLECSADCEKSLDIEGLAEGAYFVRITSEQTAPMVKKLIVR